MWQLCRCGTLAVCFEGLPPAESHYTSLRVTTRPGACPDTDSMSPALKQQRTPPGDLGFSPRHICAAQTAAQTPLWYHKHTVKMAAVNPHRCFFFPLYSIKTLRIICAVHISHFHSHSVFSHGETCWWEDLLLDPMKRSRPVTDGTWQKCLEQIWTLITVFGL